MLPRFYSARPSAFAFSLFSLNTAGDNRIIPRFGKGRRTIKTTYTLHVHVRTKGGEDERSAPSLHGLLISNFTDNGQGASFFFTPIHLLNAERALGFGGQVGWILRARRDLTRFFLLFSCFSFLFFHFRSPLSLSTSRGEYGSRPTFA